MKIIDAHVHVFDSLTGFNGKGEMKALGGGMGRFATGEECKMIPPELGDTGFSYETCHKFLMDHGIGKAVLLQGNYYGFQNEYVKEAVDAYPDMFIGAGIYDPFSLYADKLYDRLTHELGFKILKFECSDGCGLTSLHGSFSIADTFMPIAEKCEENQQVLVLDLGSPGMHSFQPLEVKAIADSFPGLKIVVCHLLAPTLKDREALKEALSVIASDNIYFDTAAVPFNVAPEKYPYPTGLEYIKTAKEIVGIDKLMWGTDIPSVLWYDTMEGLRDYLLKSEDLTEKDKESLFYENAMRVYPFDR